MTDTLLDPQCRPTTAEERAKLYRAPDPTDGLEIEMATADMECALCGDTIEATDPVWWRDMPEDSPEWRLAQHDPAYDGGPVLASYCWTCAIKELGPAVRDYAEERRQCAREERLEEAVAAEARGELTPLHWDEIAIANLGLRDPSDLADAISFLCGDYSRRFGVDNPARLEQVRAKLWSWVPMDRRPATDQLVLAPVGGVEVEHLPGGKAKLTMEVKLEVHRA